MIADGKTRRQAATAAAKRFVFGIDTSTDDAAKYGFFDIIPRFRGITTAARAGKKEFGLYGKAYDVIDGAITFDKAVMGANDVYKKNLSEAIDKIRSGYSSKLTDMARSIVAMGAGGPGDKSFTRSNFFLGQQQSAYKDLLASQLIGRGVDKKEAFDFVKQLKITLPTRRSDPTNAISIGRTKLFASDAEEHYEILLDRYTQIKNGKAFSQSIIEKAGQIDSTPENFMEKVVEDANKIFVSREFQRGLRSKIGKEFDKFYRDDLVDIASGIMKPRKEVYQDFVGPLSSAKKEFLQRKTAQVLGISLKNDEGKRESARVIEEKLFKAGFDPSDFTSLRAFLIEKGKVTSGISEGGFSLFGMKPLLVDEAIESKKFSHLTKNEQKVIGDLSARIAIDDLVSKSVGLSRLGGAYKTSTGQILDFSAVRNTLASTGRFFADEFHIPIINLSIPDLFGFQSFSEMARRGPIQYIPGNTVQPFVKDAGEALNNNVGSRSSFQIWHSTGGMFGLKGKVISFQQDDLSGEMVSTALRGTYRAIPTASTEMLSRSARRASGLGEESSVFDIDQTTSGSKFLDKLLGGPERAIAFKKRFSFDPEQPNSIFGKIGRFVNRKSDLNNPSVMSKILRGEKVNFRRKGVNKSYQIGLTEEVSGANLSIIDETGAVVRSISEEDILRSFESFRKPTFKTGLAPRVIKDLEESNPDIFTLGGKKVSEVSTPQEFLDLYRSIEEALPIIKNEARKQGVTVDVIEKSISTLRKLVAQANFLSTSQLARQSPTITTRLDEAKNEAFRFISQANAFKGGVEVENQLFIEMQRAIQKMSKTLPPGQLAESQLAALSTLANYSAFSTFKQDVSANINTRNAIKRLLSFSTAGSQNQIAGEVSRPAEVGQAVRNFFDPYVTGTASTISTNIPRPLNRLISPFRRAFGTSPYIPNDMLVDPLGSGQSTTLVPTFGTVFGRNPFGAIQSALGINTYSDPDSYSGAANAMDHIVNRLNRYFGTLGMQLNSSSFKGPLDLYARGMVGKRILPIYAAGTTFMTADREIGGFVNEKGPEGESTYSPFFTTKAARGLVEVQAISAGIIPGGMNAQEKREQLVEGEVPIRQGRYWPLGNTPFKGGKIMYYRPSWYRKLQGGALFTSQTYGSPMEKALFYNDISPLRPLDPYRFEQKHYLDRPYPETGDYFTGPFGPIVPLANATLGKILKPKRSMHKEEVQAGLESYSEAGSFGAYDASAYVSPVGFGFGTDDGQQQGFVGSNVVPIRPSSPLPYGKAVSGANASYRSAAGAPLGTASNISQGMVSGMNQPLRDLSYGPPKQKGVMNPKIISMGSPISSDSLQFESSEIGYRLQEMAGIYGFGFGSLRENFGFGQSDFEPNKAVLQSASKAYGTSRAFWDLNLGGLGDFPGGNIELSEITRRFIPKERTNVDYINPIRNTMSKEYNFMPGPEYYINFQTGDPYTKIQEGEIRLPGIGYERFNRVNYDEFGQYSLVNQLDILADVAPYSQQFKQVNAKIDSMNLSPDEKIRVGEIRSQLANTTRRNEFTSYENDGEYPGGTLGSISRVGEYLAHRDTIFNTKFLNKRTATEDWERKNVYGATFPEWQRPFESFIEPMINKSTQKNPIVAASTMGFAFSLFGRTPRAKLFSTSVGIATGGTASSIGNAYEFVSGERYIPQTRRKEMALEEYSDILTYVKNIRLSNMAKEAGDSMAANQFKQAAKRTMYGADLYGASIDTLSLAVPKRKREHFQEMIQAPEEERERILSTAGRLERRIYEAAWNMPVEEKPDLAEYFQRHELPDMSWEGWHPNTNMDHVKIKVGQQMGLEMSQMGYYPQQIKEANLSNPSYPDFSARSDNQDVLYRLRQLMSGSGISGTVSPVVNTFGRNQISVSAGVA